MGWYKRLMQIRAEIVTRHRAAMFDIADARRSFAAMVKVAEEHAFDRIRVAGRRHELTREETFRREVVLRFMDAGRPVDAAEVHRLARIVFPVSARDPEANGDPLPTGSLFPDPDEDGREGVRFDGEGAP